MRIVSAVSTCFANCSRELPFWQPDTRSPAIRDAAHMVIFCSFFASRIWYLSQYDAFTSVETPIQVKEMEGKFVVFRLGNEKFGVPIESVERILPSQPLTKIPRASKTLVGMFPYQDTTVAVIDASARFEIPLNEAPEHFLVIATEVGRYALRVEGVETINHFAEADFDEAQDWLASIEPELAYGVGKKDNSLCLLLKPEAIVPSDLKKKLTALAA